MVHPIILGYLGEPDIFNQLCGNLGACTWGELGAGRFVCAHSRCSPLKGGSSLGVGGGGGRESLVTLDLGLLHRQIRLSLWQSQIGGNNRVIFSPYVVCVLM
jgi:hypothetical protein